MGAGDAASAVRERIEPAREQVSATTAEALGRVEAAANAAAGRAGDVAAEVRDRAEEVAGEARERVTGAASGLKEAVEPAAERVRGGVTGTIRSLLAALAALPAAVSGLGSAVESVVDQATESGREVVYRLEPPRSVRRRSALRSAGWFLVGFLGGVVTGWLVSSRANPEPEWLAPTDDVDPEEGHAPAPSLPLRPAPAAAGDAPPASSDDRASGADTDPEGDGHRETA